MRFNPETSGREQLGASQAPLDWSGLRARFLAGHALRDVLGAPQNRGVSGGSFDAESARRLGAYVVAQEPGLASVNPTALGDGKDQGGKNQPVIGNTWPATEE